MRGLFKKPICNFGNLGAFAANAANRAFRSKSADLLMQILWAFRYNAPEDGRFPIGNLL
ncbi:MAG: hypothetical protein LBK44_04765 [Spirochaetales bacterium]|jgi:hypothetical protein|nr:hypothetical protein [Spirochaetales bacterium]